MSLHFHWFLPTNGDGRFGGASAEAGPVAARHSDVYLTWGEPPAAVAGPGVGGRRIVNSFFGRTGRGSSPAPAHPDRRGTSCG